MDKKRKNNINDLKIFGGHSAFVNKLILGTPNLQGIETLHKMIDDIFKKKWLTNNGQYVQKFERMIEEYLGVKNVVAVNNATTGLEISIRSLNLEKEVIVPSYTFAATPHSIQWSGIKPIFCDIDPMTYNIDPEKAEKLINKNTTGILAVDVYGRPSDKNKLESLARKYGLSLLFDSAHAFGNSFMGKMIGNFGKAEVFSFHATKFLNTFEGGAIATNDDELAKIMRAVRNFGFLDDHASRYLGINGKMTEISAAMGIINLHNIDRIIEINRQNYNAYKEGLQNISGLKLIEYSEQEKNNYQYIIIEVTPEISGLSRDDLYVVLDKEGIGTRKYFWPPCHQMEPYLTLYPNVGSELAITEGVSSRVLALPTGTAISTNDVFAICDIIRLSISEADRVKKRVRKISSGEEST